MRLLILLTVFCSLAAWRLGEAAFAQEGAKDLEKLQGEWKVEKAWEKGDEVPPEVIAKLIFKIKGDQLYDTKDPKDSLTIKLDPSKKTPQIDMVDTKNQPSQGIYEINKDTLKLYFTEGGERPKEFPASKERSKDDNAFYLELSRKK